MIRLDGKVVSTKIRAEIKGDIQQFEKKSGRPPGLAVILVGQDPASQTYVRGKIRACAEVGIQSFHHELPQATSAADLKAMVQKLNDDPKVDGILVQLPLPAHLKTDEVLSWIDPRKDPDGLTVQNQGLLMLGRSLVPSCTPAGIIEILKHYNVTIEGKTAVVVGRSQIVGKPMALLLLQENATVTIAHSKTQDLFRITRGADIVVAAAGRPHFLGREAFKQGAVVVDVGIHRTDKGLVGDVRADELEDHVTALTPVPGGVGPMTITMLLRNTLTLAQAFTS